MKRISKRTKDLQTAMCIVFRRSMFVPFYSSLFVCASMLKGDDGTTNGTAVAASRIQRTRNAIFAIYFAQTALTDDRHAQMPINMEQNIRHRFSNSDCHRLIYIRMNAILYERKTKHRIQTCISVQNV